MGSRLSNKSSAKSEVIGLKKSLTSVKLPETQTNTKKKKDKMTSSRSLWKDIRQIYKFNDVLGGGQYGTVRMAYKIGEESRTYYAIKSLSKKNLSKEEIKKIEKEVEILSSLDHPNIIKFFESYQDKHFLHIVMELCKGEEVIEKIIEEGKLTELRVCELIFKVLSAINYCHTIGISHRDIKPENILYDPYENEIKIIDFGFSRKYVLKEKMHTILGTPYYIAPEVLNGEYDQKCDVWSIGAVCFMMLSGEPPFDGPNNFEIFKNILNCEVVFDSEKFKNVSPTAIDFMKKCLNKIPEERISTAKAIEHEWFKSIQNDVNSTDKLNTKVLENIKRFSNPNKFKKLAMKYMVKNISRSEIKALDQVFHAIDVKKQGFINAEELEQAFIKANVKFNKEEIMSVMNLSKSDGKLNYTEFIMASSNQEELLTKEKLKTSFVYFDVNKDGFIDAEDLKNVLVLNGEKDINIKEIEKSIFYASKNYEKKISLEEYIQLFCID